MSVPEDTKPVTDHSVTPSNPRRKTYAGLYVLCMAGWAATSFAAGVFAVDGKWWLLAVDVPVWALCTAGASVALAKAKEART